MVVLCLGPRSTFKCCHINSRVFFCQAKMKKNPAAEDAYVVRNRSRHDASRRVNATTGKVAYGRCDYACKGRGRWAEPAKQTIQGQGRTEKKKKKKKKMSTPPRHLIVQREVNEKLEFLKRCTQSYAKLRVWLAQPLRKVTGWSRLLSYFWALAWLFLLWFWMRLHKIWLTFALLRIGYFLLEFCHNLLEI